MKLHHVHWIVIWIASHTADSEIMSREFLAFWQSMVSWWQTGLSCLNTKIYCLTPDIQAADAAIDQAWTAPLPVPFTSKALLRLCQWQLHHEQNCCVHCERPCDMMWLVEARICFFSLNCSLQAGYFMLVCDLSQHQMVLHPLWTEQINRCRQRLGDQWHL